jgi:hypothetical protein
MHAVRFILAISIVFSCAACQLKTKGTFPGDSAMDDTAPDGSCPAGEILCEGVCVDPDTDRLNCGGCGNRCEATERCVAGECVCAAGFIECGGVCVDPNIDRRHCGGCNNQCDPVLGRV